jgi:exodeoxyribonuclease VII small subunit
MKKNPAFETSLKHLEESVSRLEDDDISLEKALKLFEDGVHWSKVCNQFLEKAESRIDIILKGKSGDIQQELFDESEL